MLSEPGKCPLPCISGRSRIIDMGTGIVKKGVWGIRINMEFGSLPGGLQEVFSGADILNRYSLIGLTENAQHRCTDVLDILSGVLRSAVEDGDRTEILTFNADQRGDHTTHAEADHTDFLWLDLRQRHQIIDSALHITHSIDALHLHRQTPRIIRLFGDNA